MQTKFTRKRDAQLEQGAYDGRFKSKVVPDKKKQKSKRQCRGTFKYEDSSFFYNFV